MQTNKTIQSLSLVYSMTNLGDQQPEQRMADPMGQAASAEAEAEA